ncbi:MAG: amino acid permease, partial [Actinomycetes bacterium]
MTVPVTIEKPTAPQDGPPSLAAQLLRRKPISQMVSEAGSGEGGSKLVRSFGVLHLTMISVGATLG